MMTAEREQRGTDTRRDKMEFDQEKGCFKYRKYDYNIHSDVRLPNNVLRSLPCK